MFTPDFMAFIFFFAAQGGLSAGRAMEIKSASSIESRGAFYQPRFA